MEIIKPNRVTRSYTQHIEAPPGEVLPLLCPVREADWIEDWNPLLVISESGLVEPDCVFVTAFRPADAIWYVTRLESEAGLVEMLRVTPGVTACKLTIRLSPSDTGTDATVTYSHTSLGSDGDVVVAGFTQEFYDGLMRRWEAQLNHYLKTGACLTGSQ